MIVRRPSPEAYREALDAARRMQAADVDPHHLAHCLHYLHHRAQLYDRLLAVTDRYLRFGMPEHELSEMRQLVGHLREMQIAVGDAAAEDSTLPI